MKNITRLIKQKWLKILNLKTFNASNTSSVATKPTKENTQSMIITPYLMSILFFSFTTKLNINLEEAFSPKVISVKGVNVIINFFSICSNNKIKLISKTLRSVQYKS